MGGLRLAKAGLPADAIGSAALYSFHPEPATYRAPERERRVLATGSMDGWEGQDDGLPGVALTPEIGIPAAAGPVRVVGMPSPVPGFLYGLRHPAVIVGLAAGDPVSPQTLDATEKILAGALEAFGFDLPGKPRPGPSVPAAVTLLLHGVHCLQVAADVPVSGPGRIVGVSRIGLVAAVPTLVMGHKATVTAMAWIIRLLALVAGGVDPAQHLERLADVIAALSRQVPASSNVPRFIRAGHELGFPVCELPGHIIQFGNGRRARWLESSFTDRTPRIGAALARNKEAAAAMLRHAGVPVPAHIRVHDEEAALRAADALGYPVVVKPADLDGGVAVAPGLLNPEEVRRSFAIARAASANVLVEKHFEGRDYRLTVFNSQLLWAYERIPGSVTGDGVHTVAELVERQNIAQGRGRGRVGSSLTPLDLDDEADALMRRKGLSRASIPPAGEFVRLRRAANISVGGMPVGGVFEKVHPDNRRLVIRAADILGLDLAGVDLLMPDIARSWLETGAVICEVNGQPDLGVATWEHIYTPILRELVEGTGRIPVAVVLGAPPGSTLAAAIAADLSAGGLAAGLADASGINIAGEKVSTETDPLAAGRALMVDRKVGAAVLSIEDFGVMRSGLAVDRFDVLVVAGKSIRRPGDAPAAGNELASMLQALLPMCDGVVLAPDGMPLPRAAATTARVLPLPLPEEAAGLAARLLREAEARHRGPGAGDAVGKDP
jgi:cyanophycin synthetase